MNLGILIDGPALNPAPGSAGQMLFECAECLFHQLAAVGKEEHTLNAFLTLKQFHQSNSYTGLACAGGEHHEKTSLGRLDTFRNGFDRLDLIGAVDDALQRHGARERLSEFVQMGKPQQVLFVKEPADFAWRVKIAVPEPDFIAISEKDERINTMLGAQCIGIVGCLALTFEWIAAGALGFDDGKRSAEAIQ